ncbi:hypothetical protein CG723_44715 [Streptomyces sp. CB01635]|uniref:hypothetical protein n=1 Tax=unclassified Streptomyces TaxID=2593676 RepID=UPI000C279D64|nr:hypothetical protein [Streptomyces sp. CB01635]PJN05453.1 hypothetical protein CG723_44715 [Streptomyces sp. CB01635]
MPTAQRPEGDETDDGSGAGLSLVLESGEKNPIQAPTTSSPTTTTPVPDFFARVPLPSDRFTQ